MKYDVEVLKKMIDNLTVNIRMFSKYPGSEETLYGMVKERRDLAALVENDGVPMRGVYVDSMSYSASMPNADTSWWTRGT
jgi:hypothetical protein